MSSRFCTPAATEMVFLFVFFLCFLKSPSAEEKGIPFGKLECANFVLVPACAISVTH